MSTPGTKHVAVTGAGVGGLAAAIALRRAGWSVTVLERRTRAEGREELVRHGAGLTLWPNGVAAMARLGALQALPPVTVPIRAVTFRRWDGDVIYRDSHETFEERYGHPTMPLARADLVEALMQVVDPSTIRFGERVIDYETRDGGVTAITEAGARIDADVLVAADGISSQLRHRVVGDGPPIYSGFASWRGIAAQAPPGLGSGEGGNTWGRGEEFGWMPIVDGRVYWYATGRVALGEERGSGDAAVERGEALRRFGRWHDPIPALVASTPVSTIVRSGMYSRRPVERWGDGHVTLLGDAAHPMQPHLAQGACQALEDAVELGERLATASADAVAALRRYEDARRERANAMIRRSNQMGRTIHLGNPLACAVRDRAMRRFFRRAGIARHDRLIAGPAPTPSSA